MAEEANGAGGSVRAVDRALMLLEALGEAEEGLRLSDLAKKTKLSVSTVHRLLTTLERRHFVQFDPTDTLWHIGRQTFAIGAGFTRRRNFVAPALPHLRALRDATRETANLGVLDEGEVVTLAQAESREIMRAISPVGGRAPVTCSAMGKAMLATYPDEAILALTNEFPMRIITPKSLKSQNELMEEIATIRKKGYAVDDEEFVTGLRCVASVVYNAESEGFFAISVSGLAGRVTKDKLYIFGRQVKEAASQLTAALGGRLPD